MEKMKTTSETQKAVKNERKPKASEFKEIYTIEDMNSDIRLMKAYRNTPEYQRNVEGSYSEIMEKIVTDSIMSGDWFNEEASFAGDESYEPIKTIPANSMDDTFNHIDTICVIKNELTGGEQMPFALDETYTTSLDKIHDKFSWPHVYGKTERAPGGSEFGKAFVFKNRAGYEMQGTKKLDERFRKGLKIPGFASAKYYRDPDASESFDISDIKKGRIPVMPRFVIGFEESLVEEMSIAPNPKSKNYASDMRKYNRALLKAKCCVLSELSTQSEALVNHLDNLDEREISRMDPEELATARKQAGTMCAYFKKAMDKQRELGKNDEAISDALAYTNRDEVCTLLNCQSGLTYKKVRKAS